MTLPHNFSFVWKDLVAGSAHPGYGAELHASLTELIEHGIGAILSLTEEPLPSSPLSEFGIDYLHLPVDDFTAPSGEQIDQAIDFIKSQLKYKRGTLIHCHAGIGRTGTVLACFLVSQGHEPADAIAQVRRRRPGSCEVYTQEYAVHQYARRIKGEGGGAPS